MLLRDSLANNAVLLFNENLGNTSRSFFDAMLSNISSSRLVKQLLGRGQNVIVGIATLLCTNHAMKFESLRCQHEKNG